MTDDPDAVAPAEAFAALGDETRVEILRALYDHEREENGPPLSFSELYDHLDVEGTSTFSYHLDRLEGPFVLGTEEGYRLSPAGRRIVQAILSGTYTERPSLSPVDVDARCPACEADPMRARYEHDVVVVDCPECERAAFSYPFSPGGVDGRSPPEVVATALSRTRRKVRAILDGDCPVCGGRVEVTITDAVPQIQIDHTAVARCEQCGERRQFPPYFAVLDHPAVVAFFWDRGVDLTEKSVLDVMEAVAAGRWEVHVESTDPFETTVEIPLGDDRLVATLDGEPRVTDVRVVETWSGPDAT